MADLWENLVHKKRISVVLSAVVLTLGNAGCSPALGLQDWQRDLLSFAGSTLGGFLSAQFTNVTVVRECFEDGAAVDCASLPAGG